VGKYHALNMYMHARFEVLIAVLLKVQGLMYMVVEVKLHLLLILSHSFLGGPTVLCCLGWYF
jgi:hypothetical protein